MHISDFRKKYPEYSHLSDETIAEKLNAKYPGFITLKHKPGTAEAEFGVLKEGKPPGFLERVRRGYERFKWKHGYASSILATEVPEAEARERINIALPPNEKVEALRREVFPEAENVDDITFMEAVTAKYPEAKFLLEERKAKRDELYKQVDLIKFKKKIGAPLSAKEAFINLTVIPKSKEEVGQQTLIGFLNSASFGLSEYVLNSMGFRSTSPESGVQAVARGAGSVIGMTAPYEFSLKLASHIPLLNYVFRPIEATGKAKRFLYSMLRSGTVIGTYEALQVPEEAYEKGLKGLIQPGQRVKQFGGGFITGSPLGTIHLIPNRAARMITASLYFGLPSTLVEQSLEEQIFNYGLGAYIGVRGISEKDFDREDKIAKRIKYGVKGKRAKASIDKKIDRLLKEFRRLAKEEGDPYVDPLEMGNGERLMRTKPEPLIQKIPQRLRDAAKKAGSVDVFITKIGRSKKLRKLFLSLRTSYFKRTGELKDAKVFARELYKQSLLSVEMKGNKVLDVLSDRDPSLSIELLDNPVFRKAKIKQIKMRLNELKKERGFVLRNDKISRIFERLKGVDLNSLTNEQLFNLHEHIQPENTPPAPTNPFLRRPPARPELKGKHLTPYHHILRLGYAALEHMGFGGLFEEGLTGNVFRSDLKANRLLLIHRKLTNNWKRRVGLDGLTAERLALDRDGQINLNEIAKRKPEYADLAKTAREIGTYWRIWLDIQNRHRAKYGLKPIEPLKHYYTHVFDAVREEAAKERHPFPDVLADVEEYVLPKEKRQPFLQARKGVKGYVMNIWRALDAYAFWGTNYVCDDGLRQARRVSDFLKHEIRVNEKVKLRRSPIDLLGVKKRVDSWIRTYAGQPGRLDKFFKDSIKLLPKSWQNKLGSVRDLSGIYRTILYVSSMGWRPKLALRNLGQHALIIGMEKPRYLLRAMKMRRTPEGRRLLRYSQVLNIRELGFAPELPYTTGVMWLERLRRSAFYMFRQADRINVEDAFLTGYLAARARGASHKGAIIRGDTVAATTQYLYTKGNRGPLSDLWGNSQLLGRFASMYTTWPINKIEYMLMLAKPENRAGLLRYLTVSGLGILAGLASGGAIRSTTYTGFGAELGILRRLHTGLIDIRYILKPYPLILKDLKDAIEKDDASELAIYHVRENAPLWERF